MLIAVSLLLVAIASPFTTTAHPVLEKRDAASDLTILNFALTLEHLENAFYRDGLNNFTASDFATAGIADGVYERFQTIGSHEATHVSTLTSVITAAGGTPVPECTYNFGYTDVAGFIAVSRALERTGVSAYDGAAALITTPGYLTAAATIVTIEARHASYINSVSGIASPFPDAFDTPLDAREVVSIAGGFITSCPYDIGFEPFPSLTLDASSGLAGQMLTLTFDSEATAANATYCAFLYGATQDYAPITNNTCQLTAGVIGDVYVIATNANAGIVLGDDSSIVAGPAIFTVTENANFTHYGVGQANGWW